MDRNASKLERLISNEQLTRISVYDLRRFVPFGINLDPFLRKVIRDYMSTLLLTPVPIPIPMTPAGRANTHSQSVPVDIPRALVREKQRGPLDVLKMSEKNNALLTFIMRPLSSWRATELATFIHAVAKPLAPATLDQLMEVFVKNEVDGAVVSLMTDLNDLTQLTKLPFAKWQRVKATLSAIRERDELLDGATDCLLEANANVDTNTPLNVARQARTSSSPPANTQSSNSTFKETHTRTVSFRGLTDEPLILLSQQRFSECSSPGAISLSKPEFLVDENVHEIFAIQEVLGSRMADCDQMSDEELSVSHSQPRRLDSLAETVQDVEKSDTTKTDTHLEQDCTREDKRNGNVEVRERSKSGSAQLLTKERTSSVVRKAKQSDKGTRKHASSVTEEAKFDKCATESTALLSGSAGEKVGKFLVTKVNLATIRK